MSNYFLGIDIGTTAVKAVILDENGKKVSVAKHGLKIIIPNIGWAEQKTEDWWDSTVIAVKKVINSSKDLKKDITAIGVTGQMLGLVALNNKLEPLLNPIIWLDQRAVKEVELIKDRISSENLLNFTGNIPITGYLAPKILWIKRCMPDIYKKIYKIVLPKDYIRFLLTDQLGLEVSDMGGSYLYNVQKRCLSDNIFDLLDIPKSFFQTKIYESENIAGYLSKRMANKLGLRPRIPVIAGGSDQSVGAVGCGAVKEGTIFLNLGTSGIVFSTTDNVYLDYKNRAIIAGCHSVRGKWSLLGCTLSAGGSLKWLNDNFAIDEKKKAETYNKESYYFLDLTAEKAEIGSNGLFFLPYLNGERSPHPDPYAKGVFFGLTLSHGWPEMVRSVIEGVTYSLRDIIEIFKELNIKIEKVIATGGGAKSPFWRQVIADVFNCQIITVNNEEGPSMGAAILAMVGTKFYKNINIACNKIIKPLTITNPIRENAKKYEVLYDFYKNLYFNMESLYKNHSNL